MARHSKFERERREAETERVKQIEAAWMGSLPTATAKAFAESVATAPPAGPCGDPPAGERHSTATATARTRAQAPEGRATPPAGLPATSRAYPPR